MAESAITYETAIGNLQSLYDGEKCWRSTTINIPVSTSLSNDTLSSFNLASTLGRARTATLDVNDATCYFLPKDKYSANNVKFRKEILRPLFVYCCRLAGFSIVMKGWESSMGKTIFICNRGLLYQENKSSYPLDESSVTEKKSKRQPTTGRPLKGANEKCTFRFSVFWSDKLKRWYLPKKQNGCACHAGHAQREPDQVRIRVDALGNQERELQEQMLRTLQRPRGVSRLTYERTGIDIEPYQVSYLRKKMKGQEVVANAKIVYGQDFDPSEVTTVADRLLLSLQARKDVSFVAIFAVFDTNDLRIRSKKRRSDGLLVEADIPIDQLTDSVDSAEKFSIKVRDSLSITGSGLILLALAWTCDSASRKFQMFPEFFGSDITESTNAEERPIALLVGKCSNNFAFTHTWAFLPALSRWVHTWLFGTAVPALHPLSVLRRVQIALMDEDPQECGAFLDLCGEGKTYENAILRNCGFHKINRNFTDHPTYKAAIADVKQRDTSAGLQFDVVRYWLWHLLRSVESQEEVALACALLREYLSNVFLADFVEKREDEGDKNAGRRLQSLAKEFVFTTLHPKQVRFYKPNFNGRRHMQNDTTNAVESENRALKYTAGGPRPCDPLDASHARIADVQAVKERRRARFEASEMMTQPTSEDKRENSLPDLTRYCNQKLFEQYEQRENYAVLCVSSLEFKVKRLYQPWTGQEAFGDDLSQPSDARKDLYFDWFIPKWERTRTIKILHVNKMTVAVCDCETYIQNGWCCRHVYSILDRKPRKEDTVIRWWKTYIFFYGRTHKEINDNLNYLRDNEPPGIPISKKDIAPMDPNEINSRNFEFPINAQYFGRSLKRPALRGPSYWTSIRRGNHLPEEVLLPIGFPNQALNAPVLEHTVEFSQSQRLSQLQQDDSMNFPDEDDDDDSHVSESKADPSKEELKERIRSLEEQLKQLREGGAVENPAWNNPKKPTREPYIEIQPLINQITRDTKTQGCLAYLVDSLHQLGKEMLRRKTELTSTQGKTATTGTLSLPESDRRRNIGERKRKVTSPQKKSKRRYQDT